MSAPVKRTHLTPEDCAFLKEKAEKFAAKPIPDHIRIAVARILKSADNNTPVRGEAP